MVSIGVNASPGSARAYFVIPTTQHKELLEGRIEAFLDTPWRQHFSRV
jgi:hypothetical protein